MVDYYSNESSLNRWYNKTTNGTYMANEIIEEKKIGIVSKIINQVKSLYYKFKPVIMKLIYDTMNKKEK